MGNTEMATISGSGSGTDIVSVLNDVGTLNGSLQGTPITDIILDADSTIVNLDTSNVGDITGTNGTLTLNAQDSSLDRLDIRSGDSQLNFNNTDINDGILSGTSDVTLNMFGGTFNGVIQSGSGSFDAVFTDVDFLGTSLQFGESSNTLVFDSSTFAPNTSFDFSNGNNTIEFTGTTSFGAGSSLNLQNGTDHVSLPDGSIISYSGNDFTVGTDTLPNDFGMNGNITLPDGSSLRFNGVDSFGASGAVCFAEGTQILTASGYTPIESLQPGQFVMDTFGQPQEIMWIGTNRITFNRLNQKLRPIVFERNSSTPGIPFAPLTVSPQHNMLVQLTHQEHRPALCRAKSLLKKPGVRRKHGVRSVTYYALLLRSHSIIYANGMPCESFYPGAWSLSYLSSQDRKNIAKAMTRCGGQYLPVDVRQISVAETQAMLPHISFISPRIQQDQIA